MQSIQILSSVFFLSIRFTIPHVDLTGDKITYFYVLGVGLVEGSTQLFIQLIGPILVAANNRKTYEITMGGTMIGVCKAFPFVIGTCVAVFMTELVELGRKTSSLEQGVIMFLISIVSALPFLIPAASEITQWSTLSQPANATDTTMKSETENTTVFVDERDLRRLESRKIQNRVTLALS